VPRLVALALALLALCLATAGCGGSGAKSKAPAGQPAAAAPSQTCRKVARPAPKAETAKRPGAPLAAGKAFTVTLQTNCGAIGIRLATARAPKTAASFASLVRQGFYDGLTFHRIVAGFVIQGGDPKGDGQGGPGYQITEKPPAGLRYTRGVVAMAKTQADPPGSSGSQFFIVTGPDAQLPPDYALVGTVKSGLDAVDRIGTLRTGSDEQPTTPVVIEKATLSGS
jgi:cyclophilin family peptidyl-prolyl cis-trans isomerase